MGRHILIHHVYVHVVVVGFGNLGFITCLNSKDEPQIPESLKNALSMPEVAIQPAFDRARMYHPHGCRPKVQHHNRAWLLEPDSISNGSAYNPLRELRPFVVTQQTINKPRIGSPFARNPMQPSNSKPRPKPSSRPKPKP